MTLSPPAIRPAELLVISRGALDRLGKDGRIRRDTADPLAHQAGEGSVVEVVTRQVVQPGTLPLLCP